MNVEIYADVVFLINFIMDFFIFWIVSKLIKKKVKLRRLLLGAFLAAFLYCLIIFIPGIFNIFGVASVLMISIAACFNPKTIKEFFKLIFITIFTAFSVGGACTAIFYLININYILGNIIGFTIHNFPIKMLLLSSLIIFITIKLFIGWYRRIFIKRQSFCNLKIKFDGDDIELNALVDSGNSISDPISDDPVIVVEFDTIRNFLPEPISAIFYEKKENDLSFIIERIADAGGSVKIRMIPFSSIGKQHGMLIGLKAESVVLSDNINSITLNNAIIAIYNFKLSKDGFYHALLNPDILY